MANKTRDVELVIRAKNEATKAISAVTNGLKELSGEQDKAGKSAERAGGLLSKFGAEARTLRDNFANLKQFEKASAGIERMAQSVDKSRQELSNLNQQTKAVEAEQARLAQAALKAKAALDAQAASAGAVAVNLSKADKDLARAQSRYKTLYDEIKKTKEPSDALKDSLRQQRDALVRAIDAHDALKNNLAQETQAGKDLAASARGVDNALKNAERNQEDLGAAVTKTTAQLGAQVAKLKELAATNTVNTGATAGPAAQATNAYRAQIQAVKQAEAAYVSAREQASKLGAELKKTATPSKELQLSFDLAKVASAQARQEWVAQGVALTQMRGEIRNSANDRRAATQALIAEGIAEKKAVADKQASVVASAAARAAKQAEVDANKRLAQSHKDVSDAARRSLDLSQRIRGQVLSMIAAYVGLPAIANQLNQVVKAYQSLEATQNRLGVVFGDTAKVSQELDWLRRNADRLKTSFQVLAEEYGRFSIATKGTNLQGAETRRIFLSVAEAGRVNKLSTEQMSRVFLALTQMISKGKIQAEELRQQLGDALPGAMQILATGMGKTTAELDKMMEKGEVGIDNLSKFASELDKRFGTQLSKSLQTVTSSFGDFENASYQAKLQFANGGFIDALQDGLDRLTQYLRSAEAASLINMISSATGGLITVLSNIPQYIRPIIVLSSAFIGLKLASAFIGLAGSVGTARVALAAGAVTMSSVTVAANGSRVAILAAAAATRSWGILAAAAGGPVGIAIAAVTTLLGVWLTRTDDATEAMTEHRRIVDVVKNAYDKADKSAGNWAEKIKGVTTSQAQANLEALRGSMKDLVDDMDATSAKFRTIAQMPIRNLSPAAEEGRKSVALVVSALDDLKAGQITLDEFKERIDAVNQATKNKAVKEWTLQLQDMADKAKETERSLKEANLVLKTLTGTTEDAAKAGAELSGSLDQAGDSASDAAEKLKRYEKALNDIKKNVPSLKLDVEKAEDLDKLNTLVKTLMADGPPTVETLKIIEQAKAAIEEKYTTQLLGAMPSLSTGFFNRLVQVESGGDSKAKASTSSATGIAQFTERTWLSLFDKVFPALAAYDNAAKLALRTNDEMSKKMLERLTQENQQALASKGIAATDTTLYLAHFLGSGDAIKVLLANPNELAANIVKAESVNANKSVFKPGMTAGDLIGWSAKKMGASGGQTGLKSVQNADLLSSGRTQAETDAAAAAKKRQEEEDALVKKRKEANRELDAEIKALGQSATQREIINELSKLGLSMESEEGRLLAEKITKKNEERDLQQIITDLQTQQSSLQAQIGFATEQGDQSAVERLKLQLQEVNAELAKGVQTNIAYWTAMGGPNADAAIAKLKSVNTQTENLNRKFLMTGQQINEMVAGNVVGAFDTMAQAIANGENAFSALGDAFRQIAADFLLQIGKMILQQAIFNALQSSGFGGAVAGAVGGLFHQGGVAGQATQLRAINPAWFSGAVKYHSGGVAGLKSNEVPAILERGETIRTEEQEAALQGRSAGGGGTPNIKIVNAIDSGEFISQGLGTEIGEKAIFNFMRANKSAIKSALG